MENRQRLILLVLCGVLFFWGLGDRDLNSSHEARAAQNAQMVLTGGHWLLPRLYDGHLELQKPPLYYWLVALLGFAGGGEVGPWAVRLPAALSALGCVLFLHLLGCRRGRPMAGFLAALTLATCLHFTWLARVGRIDMPLTFAITVAVGSFHLGVAGDDRAAHRGWFFLGYTAVGVGVLLKGPIALVLPALVAGVALAADGRPSVRSAWQVVLRTWWGVPWIVLIAAPWFVCANIATDGRLWDTFFWYHNVERGLGGSETLKANPWWFYGPGCLVDLLPWSLAFPLIAWDWLRHREARCDPETRLGLRWFVAVFAFLSCMSFKRADYLLPAYPGFALLLGSAGERLWLAHKERRSTLTWALGTAVVAMVLGWGSYNTWAVPRQEHGRPYERIAQRIRADSARPVIFFRAESHVLAFHLGQPLDTILEWENLQWWAGRDFPVYIVMPEDEARDWPTHLRGVRLEEVLRTREWSAARRDHAMVVLRTMGRAGAAR
jgi:4-amino-4-deoxy-L-arabinose transferase-like glycosyltransferase